MEKLLELKGKKIRSYQSILNELRILTECGKTIYLNSEDYFNFSVIGKTKDGFRPIIGKTITEVTQIDRYRYVIQTERINIEVEIKYLELKGIQKNKNELLMEFDSNYGESYTFLYFKSEETWEISKFHMLKYPQGIRFLANKHDFPNHPSIRLQTLYE